MGVSMARWLLKGVPIAAAVIVMAAAPARAQTLGVGLSFLSNDGGTGVTADYSGAISQSGERTMGWVGDVSFHRKKVGGDLAGAEVTGTTITGQGGVRLSAPVNDKLSWHAQGMVGIAHTSVNVSAAGLNQEICDAFGLDCSVGASDNSVVVTPGAGIDYMFGDKTALRAQGDLFIGRGGGSAFRFWVGVSFKMGS